uniref:Ribosomal protein S3 n=1 Tax=Romanomermis culicivorax TaxID=13658 RepID=A0A915IB63_ROMCU
MFNRSSTFFFSLDKISNSSFKSATSVSNNCFCLKQNKRPFSDSSSWMEEKKWKKSKEVTGSSHLIFQLNQSATICRRFLEMFQVFLSVIEQKFRSNEIFDYFFFFFHQNPVEISLFAGQLRRSHFQTDNFRTYSVGRRRHFAFYGCFEIFVVNFVSVFHHFLTKIAGYQGKTLFDNFHRTVEAAFRTIIVFCRCQRRRRIDILLSRRMLIVEIIQNGFMQEASKSHMEERRTLNTTYRSIFSFSKDSPMRKPAVKFSRIIYTTANDRFRRNLPGLVE